MVKFWLGRCRTNQGNEFLANRRGAAESNATPPRNWMTPPAGLRYLENRG